MKTIRQLAFEKAREAAGPEAVGRPTMHSPSVYYDNPKNTRWQEDRIITSLINGVADQAAEIPPTVEFPEDVDVPIFRPDKPTDIPPLTEEQKPFYRMKARRGISKGSPGVGFPCLVMIDETGKKVKG